MEIDPGQESGGGESGESEEFQGSCSQSCMRDGCNGRCTQPAGHVNKSGTRHQDEYGHSW